MFAIKSDFDGGNIDVLDASDPGNVRLAIKEDGAAKFFQWFCFEASGVAAKRLTFVIENAHSASYVPGWENYQAVASYDGERWFRVETSFDGKALKIMHASESDKVFIAYFAAYPTARYRSFVDEIKASGAYDHSVLARTLDQQEIDYFQIGEGQTPFWVIARQHPGETMGSWWMEGFLRGLMDANNVAAVSLRQNTRLHVIPCMNLDGANRGHLRTNAAGIDLNRAWRNTTEDKSPEVFYVREAMHASGVSFFLDVHGDEAIPNNFLDSAKGIPSWDDTHEARFDRFSDLLLAESKDFQTEMGYPTAPPGKANLDIATNYVAETWGCLAMTLEMPFKDAIVNPDPVYGWSPERCRNFAHEHISVMAKMAAEG